MNLSYLFIILEYIIKTDKDLGIYIYEITAFEAELYIFAEDIIEILLILAFFLMDRILVRMIYRFFLSILTKKC